MQKKLIVSLFFIVTAITVNCSDQRSKIKDQRSKNAPKPKSNKSKSNNSLPHVQQKRNEDDLCTCKAIGRAIVLTVMFSASFIFYENRIIAPSTSGINCFDHDQIYVGYGPKYDHLTHNEQVVRQCKWKTICFHPKCASFTDVHESRPTCWHAPEHGECQPFWMRNKENSSLPSCNITETQKEQIKDCYYKHAHSAADQPQTSFSKLLIAMSLPLFW